jgi:hypothetical protein
VALEDNGLAILIAGSGGDFHYYVSGGVRECFHPMLLTPFEEEGTHLLFMLGRTGIAGQLVEIIPDECGFQIFDG